MAESSYLSAQSSSPDAKGRAQSFNEKLEELKKFASTSFTRAKQYTIEKIGKAESVTSYDSEFESLGEQLEAIKASTEKIISHVQAMVQPNPGVRLEDTIYSRLERPKPHRSMTEELLGAEMSKASYAFGVETEYGSYLKQCGLAEVKLGQSLLQYHGRLQREFVTPLKAFLEVDIKNALRERKSLGIKRLDLDAAKARAKKLSEGEKLQQAETELRESQAEFDMQLDRVREAMRRVVQTHTHHLGYLKTFIASQKAYHRDCLSHLEGIDTEGVELSQMESLQFRAVGGSGGSDMMEGDKELRTGGTGKFVVNSIELDREDTRQGRVLYDYEAKDEEELTVYCDQEVAVIPIPDDDNYMMAEIEGKFGKIPSAYVELL